MARIDGPGAAILAGIVALAVACSIPQPAAQAAPAAPAAPEGLAGEDGPGGASSTRVVAAGAQLDTLDHDWREVFPVAVEQLEEDRWEIQRADTARRRIVTRWKEIDHMLARLALGDVMARCVVDLEPLGPNRTVVRVRGGLASAEDLRGNPMFGPAQGAYRKAARKYVARVRGELERRSATATR
jgi:hypothetical protein